MKLGLIPVRLHPDSPVVVLHTPEQYARLIKGVELDLARRMFAPLEEDE